MTHTQRSGLMGMPPAGDRVWLGSCSGGRLLLCSLQPISLHQARPQEVGVRRFYFFSLSSWMLCGSRLHCFQPHWSSQIGLFLSNNGTENSVSYKSPGPPPIGTIGWSDKKVPVYPVIESSIKFAALRGLCSPRKGANSPLVSTDCEAINCVLLLHPGPSASYWKPYNFGEDTFPTSIIRGRFSWIMPIPAHFM